MSKVKNSLYFSAAGILVNMNIEETYNPLIAKRFRGFLPVIVDIETSGFDGQKNALLEIAAVTIRMDDQGCVHPHETIATNIYPFEGAILEPAALEFNGIIDPKSPLRNALEEREALQYLFAPIRRAIKKSACKRAILTAHNAGFDMAFLTAAIARSQIKRNPFHPFSTFDTVSFAGLAYGQTVLAKAIRAADIEWDANLAHSAIYDAEKTAELFCKIVNQWQFLTQSGQKNGASSP
jgi:ribonuclease T